MSWNRVRLSLILVTVLAMLMAGCFGIPRREPVEVSHMVGTVVDAESTPVKDAVIAFQGATTTTDANGNYAFKEVESGEHELKVYVQGVLSYMGTIVVPDESFVADIELFENLLPNPTFVGAEESIPPTDWSKYGTHDDVSTITVVDSEDAEKRALLVADNSNDHEIGLSANVPAQPGRRYQAVIRAGAVEEVDDNRVYLQIRFLPSGTRLQITAEPEVLEGFEDFPVVLDAPADTKSVTIYLYTPKGASPTSRVHSISLWDMGSAE